MDSSTFICQSCGMPLIKPEDFGTNTDGSQNTQFCTYCFQKGDYTWHGSLPEYIEKMVSMHEQMGITEDQARKMATENLPKLKRWADI